MPRSTRDTRTPGGITVAETRLLHTTWPVASAPRHLETLFPSRAPRNIATRFCHTSLSLWQHASPPSHTQPQTRIGGRGCAEAHVFYARVASSTHVVQELEQDDVRFSIARGPAAEVCSLPF